MTDKACRMCHSVSAGPVCPNCKSTNLSTDWTGIVYILDPEGSVIAKKLEVTKKGKYALRVR